MNSPLTLTVNEAGHAAIGPYRLFSGNLSELLDTLSRLAAENRVAFVATPNVDHVIGLQESPEFAAAYALADVHPVDGAPIVALARALGARDVHRLTGADLLGELCRRAREEGSRVVIAGGSDDALTLAVAHLRDEYLGLDIEGVPFPILQSSDDPASRSVIDRFSELQGKYVFLCLGTPKQELWFGSWVDELPPAVYIGAGAAVDFAAGTARRAPAWVQRLGSEWLWRLAHEPRRLSGRYLRRGPRFLAVVARSVLGSRRSR